MAGETLITVVGNLTGDVELKFTPSGAAVANFTVASTPRAFDKAKGEFVDGEPLFLRCSLWRQPAENAAESLRKGMRVIVTGALKQRSYETREGEKRSAIELAVEEIAVSLKFATATVQRASRDGASRGASNQRAQQRPADDPWATGGGSGGWGGGNADPEPPF